MPIGPTVRRMCGPLECPVTDLYRAFFVDLGHQVRQVRRWAPFANKILEIGCGEGAICQRLVSHYPQAEITGIDITPKIGRLFRGDRARVTFAQMTAQAFAEKHPAQFDLILICDVLHHVPWDLHARIFQTIRALLRPSGLLVLKDWEHIPNLGHILCEFSDRVLSGDTVRYGTQTEWRQKIEDNFGAKSIIAARRVSPWRNNLMFLIQPTTGRDNS